MNTPVGVTTILKEITVKYVRDKIRISHPVLMFDLLQLNLIRVQSGLREAPICNIKIEVIEGKLKNGNKLTLLIFAFTNSTNNSNFIIEDDDYKETEFGDGDNIDDFTYYDEEDDDEFGY